LSNLLDLEELETALARMSKEELFKLVKATDDLASRTDTKFHLYEPTIVAKAYHASNARYRAVFGANRSSKSYSHIMDYAIQFTGEVPPALEGTIPKHRLDQTRRLRFCMIDRPNFFDKVIWPHIQQLIPSDKIKAVIKFQGHVQSIENEKGGFIEFMFYSQDDQKFAGASRHSIGYDEEPPEDIHKENKARIIDTAGEMTFSLTPISGAMQHLYDTIYLKRGREVENEYDFVEDPTTGRLIDIQHVGYRDIIIPEGENGVGNPQIHVFFQSLIDNPIISKKDAIEILNDYTREERIVRGKGKFIFLSGLVYKEYSDHRHLVQGGSWWHSGESVYDFTIYVAVDPHPRTPHAVLFLAAQRGGPLFIVDELFIQASPEELAERIKEKLRGRIPEIILVDPLAWSPDILGGGSDFATEFNKAMVRNCIICPIIKAPKDPTNGIIRTQKLFELDEQERPGIYVADNCTRFRYEIAHFVWDDWVKSSNRGEKQTPVDKDDHMMENLYRLILIDPQWKRERIRQEDTTTQRMLRKKTKTITVARLE